MFKVLQLATRQRTFESISCVRQATRSYTGLTNKEGHLGSKNLIYPSVFTSFTRDFSAGKSKMSKALIIVADGNEDMETVVVADVLRRGNIKTTIAGLNSANPIVCAQGIKMVPDTSLDEAAKDQYDVVILPGGMDATNAYCESAKVGELLKKQEGSDKYIAAICAAPMAFMKHKIGVGSMLTSYPSLSDKFTDYKYVSDKSVVVDRKMITSRGPGTADVFALEILSRLDGGNTHTTVKQAMLLRD